ncbi:MAG: hypothetical protein WKG07_21530 [Hymenobacter sp.]
MGDDLTNTDFENLAGWGTDVSSLTREHAHSGRYAAAFVGPDRRIQPHLQAAAGAASVHALQAVDLSGLECICLPQAGGGPHGAGVSAAGHARPSAL